jgi:hypothetical protein
MTGDGTEAISDRERIDVGLKSKDKTGNRRNKMETWYYVVVSIDGDYANLKRTDIESDDVKLVARALLPEGIAEGTNLKYEFMQYSIV